MGWEHFSHFCQRPSVRTLFSASAGVSSTDGFCRVNQAMESATNVSCHRVTPPAPNGRYAVMRIELWEQSDTAAGDRVHRSIRSQRLNLARQAKAHDNRTRCNCYELLAFNHVRHGRSFHSNVCRKMPQRLAVSIIHGNEIPIRI
jgi:hypothetical protein